MPKLETIQEVAPPVAKRPAPPLPKDDESAERAKNLADFQAKLRRNTFGKASQAQSSGGATQSSGGAPQSSGGATQSSGGAAQSSGGAAQSPGGATQPTEAEKRAG